MLTFRIKLLALLENEDQKFARKRHLKNDLKNKILI